MRPFIKTPPRKRTLTLLTDHIFEALMERACDVKRADFERVLVIGTENAARLGALKQIGHLETRETPTEGDLEHFPYPPESLDLIVCCGGLHTANDLPGVLVQMRRALKPDGLFLAALVGGETLHELRESLLRVETRLHGGAAPRVHPMIDLQTMSGLMQRAGFALPVVDADIKTIFYRNINQLFDDIKASGESIKLAQRSKRYLGSAFWHEVEKDYQDHHAEPDGLLRATIEVLYTIGWGPADSQQKPLKPGSAQNRLADALGTKETKI